MVRYVWSDVEKFCLKMRDGDIISSGSGELYLVKRAITGYWLKNVARDQNVSWPVGEEEFRRKIKDLQYL